MQRLKTKISAMIIGMLAGAAGISASSSCRAECTSCYGCAAAGGLMLLYALFGRRGKMLRRK